MAESRSEGSFGAENMEKGGRDRHEYDDRILLRQRMTPVVRRARVPLNREIRYSGPGALSPRSWARGCQQVEGCVTDNKRASLSVRVRMWSNVHRLCPSE